MTPVQAIIAKELRSYFVSPVVYAVGSVFLLIVGLLAYLYVVFAGAQAIQLMQVQGSRPDQSERSWSSGICLPAHDLSS